MCEGSCVASHQPLVLYMPFAIKGVETPAQLLIEEIERTPAHHSSLEFTTLSYGKNEVEPSQCLPNPEPNCRRALGVMPPLDIGRSDHIDRWLIQCALWARLHLVPVAMSLMVIATCGVLVLLVAFTVRRRRLIESAQSRRLEFERDCKRQIAQLAWMGTIMSLLGFALTVIGLAAAFASGSGGQDQFGLFSDKVSIALSSTLCGIAARVLCITHARLLEGALTEVKAELRLESKVGE